LFVVCGRDQKLNDSKSPTESSVKEIKGNGAKAFAGEFELKKLIVPPGSCCAPNTGNERR
jgi:hypothetical protein